MEGLSALADVIPTSIVKLNLANNAVTNSGTNMSGVVKFANAIQDMGSLSELDLSKNNLRSEGLSVVSEALKSTSIKQLNIADNMVTYNQRNQQDMSGVIKFAEDVKDMGSLASLDISDNNIGDEQEAKIKQICAGKSIKFTR
jgi:hypothetical protein